MRRPHKAAALRAHADRIVVVAEGRIVGEHAREFGRDKVMCNTWRYLRALARKSGALRNGEPFRHWDYQRRSPRRGSVFRSELRAERWSRLHAY